MPKKSSVVSRQSSDKKTVKATVISSETRNLKVKTKPADSSLLAQNDKPKQMGGLSVPVYSLVGKAAGSMDLPKEIFGVEINQTLLAQAMRVYLNNQKSHWGHTKTRGEVEGSTRKIYSQKGTGRARHGAKYAPIFVGGGRAFGPKYRKVELHLPKKMRIKAVISALAAKAKDQEVLGLSGLEKASGKTKEMAKLMTQLSAISRQSDKKAKSMLIVTGEKQDNVVRAARNILGLNVLPADLVNAFEVIKHHSLILTKEAVEKLQERLTK